MELGASISSEAYRLGAEVEGFTEPAKRDGDGRQGAPGLYTSRFRNTTSCLNGEFSCNMPHAERLGKG